MYASHHIAFHCVDRKRQERFYVRHFGFKRCRVFHAGKPNEFVMLRQGSMCIELFAAKPEHLDRKAGEQPIGFRHLAFTVPDLEAKIGELNGDGIRTGNLIDCSDLSEGLRICFFSDPEGNVIELMEGWSDDPRPPALE